MEENPGHWAENSKTAFKEEEFEEEVTPNPFAEKGQLTMLDKAHIIKKITKVRIES